MCGWYFKATYTYWYTTGPDNYCHSKENSDNCYTCTWIILYLMIMVSFLLWDDHYDVHLRYQHLRISSTSYSSGKTGSTVCHQEQGWDTAFDSKAFIIVIPSPNILTYSFNYITTIHHCIIMYCYIASLPSISNIYDMKNTLESVYNNCQYR